MIRIEGHGQDNGGDPASVIINEISPLANTMD